MFSRPNLVKRITQLKVVTHQFSHSQSKAAIDISFLLDDAVFHFLNCDLDDSNVSNRLSDLEEMHQQLLGPLEAWQ